MANPISSAFRSAYDLAFQVSPIILNGGSAANANGGMLPIIALISNLTGFVTNAIQTGSVTLDDFPVRFVPVPGGTVINNAIGTYPFANQLVAANAIIKQPTNISLLMISPVNSSGGYLTKLAYLTSIQTALENHVQAGGTFHIATPGYIYKDCLLTSMTDVTGGDTKQQQVSWQLDFVRPLITQEQAQSAYSALMSKLAAGQQVTSPTWSGSLSAIGQSVQGGAQGIQGLPAAINQFLSSPL